MSYLFDTIKKKATNIGSAAKNYASGMIYNNEEEGDQPRKGGKGTGFSEAERDEFFEQFFPALNEEIKKTE